MHLARVFFLLALPAAAQSEHFSFGLTGGIPLTAMTRNPPGADESRRYTFGLTFEARLDEHVSVNVNPLYKRTGFRSDILFNPTLFGENLLPNPQSYQSSTRARTHSLELPIIGKYTFRPGNRWWRPFLGSGFALGTGWERLVSRTVITDLNLGKSQVYDGNVERRVTLDIGAVASMGVDLKRGRFHFLPEIRYTRWAAPVGTSHNRNQAEALLSIRF